MGNLKNALEMYRQKKDQEVLEAQEMARVAMEGRGALESEKNRLEITNEELQKKIISQQELIASLTLNRDETKDIIEARQNGIMQGVDRVMENVATESEFAIDISLENLKKAIEKGLADGEMIDKRVFDKSLSTSDRVELLVESYAKLSDNTMDIMRHAQYLQSEIEKEQEQLVILQDFAKQQVEINQNQAEVTNILTEKTQVLEEKTVTQDELIKALMEKLNQTNEQLVTLNQAYSQVNQAYLQMQQTNKELVDKCNSLEANQLIQMENTKQIAMTVQDVVEDRSRDLAQMGMVKENLNMDVSYERKEIDDSRNSFNGMGNLINRINNQIVGFKTDVQKDNLEVIDKQPNKTAEFKQKSLPNDLIK